MGRRYQGRRHPGELKGVAMNDNAATRIVMLGTGTPRPDPARSGPATAIVVDDTPYLIDFGVAWLRSDSSRLLNRLWFDLGKQMDLNAWIKLKYQRRVDALSPPDTVLYRPLLLERVARWIRIPWQKLTLRRPSQRWRARRNRRDR